MPGVALSFAFAPASTAAPASAPAALASTVPAVALLGFFGRPRHQPVAALAGWAGYHAVLRQVQRLLRQPLPLLQSPQDNLAASLGFYIILI